MPTMFCEHYTVRGVMYCIEHVITRAGQSYYQATPMTPGQKIKHTDLAKLKRNLVGDGRDPDGRYQR